MRIEKLMQNMSHLRKRSETTLGCMTADRAVADGPHIHAGITPTQSRQRSRCPAGLGDKKALACVLLPLPEHCTSGGVETASVPYLLSPNGVPYVRERQKPQRPLPRYAEGYLLRRKADFEGAAEDGEGRPLREAARGIRKASRRDRRPGPAP